MPKRSKKVDESKIRKIQKAIKQHKSSAPEEMAQENSDVPSNENQDIDFLQAGIEAREGEEDKENGMARPRSLMDPHPSAKRMQWDDDEAAEDGVDDEGDFAAPQPVRNSERSRHIRDEPYPGPVVKTRPTGAQKVGLIRV